MANPSSNPFEHRPRWKAVLTYRIDDGVEINPTYFEEIEELRDVVEYGPNFDTLVRCLLTINGDPAPVAG